MDGLGRTDGVGRGIAFHHYFTARIFGRGGFGDRLSGHRRSAGDKFLTAMVATVTAGLWSVVSGNAVVAAVAILGFAT